MKGLIIGSGRLGDLSLLKEEAASADRIVCADGGALYLSEAGILPDVLLGDMDSIAPEKERELRDRGVEILVHPAEKDDTDMALAVRYLAEQGAGELHILGGTGSRIDHMLGNALLVSYAAEKGIRIELIDENNVITALRTETVSKKREYLSVIPLDETVVVSLKGVKYPLDTHTIRRGSSLGISNEILEDTCDVILHEGRGLLIQSSDA